MKKNIIGALVGGLSHIHMANAFLDRAGPAQALAGLYRQTGYHPQFPEHTS